MALASRAFVLPNVTRGRRRLRVAVTYQGRQIEFHLTPGEAALVIDTKSGINGYYRIFGWGGSRLRCKNRLQSLGLIMPFPTVPEFGYVLTPAGLKVRADLRQQRGVARRRRA